MKLIVMFSDTKIKIANSNQLNLYKGLYSLAAQIFMMIMNQS
jgi:hypothetical protein